MGISKSFPVAETPVVLTGQQVTKTVYTDKGFNAGDYVYSYANGSVGRNPNLGAALPGGAIYNVIGGANGGSWGAGSSLAASSIISPTLAGLTYSVTYPTVTFGGSYLSSTSTFNDLSTAYVPDTAALTNGNVVIAYYNSSNAAVFKIYNSSGGLVNSGTVGAAYAAGSWGTDNMNVAVCALNSGGFVVVYCAPSGYLTLAKYDASGNQVVAPVTSAYSAPYMSAAADSSDNVYVIGTANLSGSNTTYIYKFNSSMVYQGQFNCGSVAGGNIYYVQPRITVSKGGYIGWIYSSNTTYVYMGIINSSMSSVFYQGQYSALSASRCSVCAGPVSGFFFNWGYSTYNIYWQYLSDAGSSSGVGSITGSCENNTYYGAILACPYFGSPTAHTYDATQNAAIVYWSSNAGSSPGAAIRYSIVKSNSTSVLSTGSTSCVLWSSYGRFMSASGNSGANYIVDFDTSSSSYYKLQMVGNYDLSGTVTVDLPANLLTNYSNGYLLLGVAATTASADSYGSVIINGVAPLGSSYGTSTTPYAFNYNPVNVSGQAGNKGYVVNRTVTLQGLQ